MNHKTDKTLNSELKCLEEVSLLGKEIAVTRMGKRNGKIRTEDCLGIIKNVTDPNIRFWSCLDSLENILKDTETHTFHG